MIILRAFFILSFYLKIQKIVSIHKNYKKCLKFYTIYFL